MDSGDLGQNGAHAQCLVKVVSRGEAAAVITPRLGTVARTVLAYPEQQGAATSNLVQVVTEQRETQALLFFINLFVSIQGCVP